MDSENWENADDQCRSWNHFYLSHVLVRGEQDGIQWYVLWGFARANFTRQRLLCVLSWSFGMILQAPCGLVARVGKGSLLDFRQQVRDTGCDYPGG